MPDVKVTILMPAWNAGKFIAEAIDSVLKQSFTDFELLIVNDGSWDNTLSEIKKINDPRIRIIGQEHQGIAIALNHGLQEAKGTYIARFDADDICHSHRLERQFNFLNNNPDYVLVGCDAEYIAENGEHLFNFFCTGHTHEEITRQLYKNCPFIHSGVMFKKDLVLEANGYSGDAHNFEDYFLWRRLIKYGKYHNLNEQLIKVRFNPSSATIDERWRGSRFRRLKRKVIQRGFISKEEAKELYAIVKSQDAQHVKEGAYYALCGKKFLINNHQPAKARTHFIKAIRYYPFRLETYALYLLSFFPQPFLLWLNDSK